MSAIIGAPSPISRTDTGGLKLKVVIKLRPKYKPGTLRFFIYYGRDNGKCRRCAGDGEEVHHIVPRASGGPDSSDNLITLCKPCHKSIHKSIRRNSSPTIHTESVEWLGHEKCDYPLECTCWAIPSNWNGLPWCVLCHIRGFHQPGGEHSMEGLKC